VLGSTSLYFYILVTLFEWKRSPMIAHITVWLLALAAEATIFICRFHDIHACKKLGEYSKSSKKSSECLDDWTQGEMIIVTVRIFLLLGLCIIYSCLWTKNRYNHYIHSDDETDDASSSHSDHSEDSDHTGSSEAHESIPLLGDQHRSYSGQNVLDPIERGAASTDGRNAANGSAEPRLRSTPGCVYKDEQAAFYRPKKLPKRNWWEYLRGYTLFWPYLWPKDSIWLQARVVVCLILVGLQRGVNVLLPFQVGNLTDRLAGKPGGPDLYDFAKEMPWLVLFGLNLLMLLQGEAGLLGSLRSIIWVKVSQYSYKSLETSAFEHVHALSLDFHLGKRTGEVLSALNKGGAINTFLEQVTFQLIPMIIDLFLAIYFFHKRFDATFGTIVTINTFWYLYLTIKMAQTRVDQRREMTNADREEEAVKNDSITSYETVKYFNAEQYEFKRYRDAIDSFQRAEAKVSYGTNLMSIAQSFVFISGLAIVLMVGAWQVSRGYRTVGGFVALMTYLNQMQGPLNFFSRFYRTIQQALISGERLLELFKIQPSVVDLPHTKLLEECHGHIAWKNVEFAYGDQRPALKKFNFECLPGTTTAFVGESGGGKSTVFRLMFRYYNCSGGRIEIDGHDVKDVTIDSVRRYIGVVPQDTILFNETLMYNLKYANPAATDQDVYEACKAASIHDRILSFPDQYNTKVGERGLRLSGGEKQRVAIARTILKNPKIIMLDEATSALDTHTEQQIQEELSNLGQGRTLLVIA
jgi:ABC-type transport system involved in Fe-S cluster assembly fused permease/ATPase subunit